MDTSPNSYLLALWPVAWRRTLRLLVDRDPHGRNFWVVDVPQPLQDPSEAWQYVDVAVDQYLRECPAEHERVGRARVYHAVRRAILAATPATPGGTKACRH